jgi:hypothetical protein
LARGQEELRQAESLDPRLAETHVVRHEIFWSVHEGFNIPAAVRELHLAQQLDPSIAHTELSSLYNHVGLTAVWQREIRRAFEIDPTAEAAKGRFLEGCALAGDYREAIAGPKLPCDNLGVVLGLLWANRLVEAAKCLENPANFLYRSHRARLWALQGRFREAEAEVTDVSALGRRSRAYHHATYNIAAVYALAGKSREAVRWLRETVDTGMPDYPLFERDPHLDRIRSAPEFAGFMSELKLKWNDYEREFR